MCRWNCLVCEVIKRAWHLGRKTASAVPKTIDSSDLMRTRFLWFDLSAQPSWNRKPIACLLWSPDVLGNIKSLPVVFILLACLYGAGATVIQELTDSISQGCREHAILCTCAYCLPHLCLWPTLFTYVQIIIKKSHWCEVSKQDVLSALGKFWDYYRS